MVKSTKSAFAAFGESRCSLSLLSPILLLLLPILHTP